MFEYERIIDAVKKHPGNLIVCLESAAHMNNLFCGYVNNVRIHAYSKRNISVPGFTVYVEPNCFKLKKYRSIHGILCTTQEQTLMDLLDQEDSVDTQVLLESLSTYYFEHGESFSDLIKNLNSRQLKTLDKWKTDAIEYYTED